MALYTNKSAASPGGSGFTPGASTRIPFGNSGGTALTDSADYTWNDTTKTLTVGGTAAGVIVNRAAGSSAGGEGYGLYDDEVMYARFYLSEGEAATLEAASGKSWTMFVGGTSQFILDGSIATIGGAAGTGSRAHRFTSAASASSGLPAGPRQAGGSMVASSYLVQTPDASGVADVGIGAWVFDTVAASWKCAWAALNRAGAPDLRLIEDGGTMGIGGASVAGNRVTTTLTNSDDTFRIAQTAASSNGILRLAGNVRSIATRIFGSTYGGGGIFGVVANGAVIEHDGTALGIGLSSNAPLWLVTNNTERMRISGDGDVAIGSTTDANHRLKITKPTAVSLGVFATGSQALANAVFSGNAGETEAAAILAGANDATSTLMGVNRAVGAFFYGKAAITSVVIGGTKSDSVVRFTPGNSEKASIDGLGNFSIGTAAIATTATDGFLYITSCAGTPTGVPTSKTGRVPLQWDSVAKKLYVYDGAWLDVT